MRRYLDNRLAFHASNYHEFTTRSRLMTFDIGTLAKHDTIFIDEDILMNCMIYSQIEITISTLTKVLEQIDAGSRLAKKINAAFKAAAANAFFELPQIPYESANDTISIRADIPSFCKAEKFFFKKKSEENNLLENSPPEESIIFFKPQNLHPNAKYIILSATADHKIYNYRFGENRIEFYNCERARYIGTLNQYLDDTMSRDSMNKNPGIIDRIVKATGVEDIITFKKYERGYPYFGKTTGIDSLKGKDLNVIGTPNYPPFVYKLFVHTLGFNHYENANWNYRKVTHKGMKFKIMTFDEGAVRDVHFWILESELEQAVGRARLLRERCTVNVFSNYPLGQANRKNPEY